MRYGSKVVRVGLDENFAPLDGPDAFRIAIPKVRPVGRPRPVDGNRYSLAVRDLVKAQRPVPSKKVKCTTIWPVAVTA